MSSPTASSRTATMIVGGILTAACLIWIGLLVRGPVLTYDVEEGGVVQLRCTTIYGVSEGHVTTGNPPAEIVEGSARVEIDDDEAALLGTGKGGAGKVLDITRAQLTADCASARVRRLTIALLPGLGAVVGLVMLIGPAVSSPSAPRTPRRR